MRDLFTKRYTKETEIGKIYGHLKVLDFTEHHVKNGKKIRAKAIVMCLNCSSAPYEIEHHALVSKTRPTKSCGCINTRRTSHNLRHHKFYNTCCSAITRCQPNKSASIWYHDRGIRCHWSIDTISDFIRYLEENLPERQEGESLDRIDNDKGYEPGNLRWASKSQQTLNRRRMISNHQFDALKEENKRLVAEIKLLKQRLGIA
ncbi:MAG TPA: hypothetical protein VI423_03795 [Paenisporosarcina sp.]|nr:hypothetical protein [Paenisporosarcina sp.]